MDTKIKHYEKLIMQRLRDIAGITKSTKRNEMDKSRKKLPETDVYVSVKRYFSVGTDGYTGRENLEWLTVGRVNKYGTWSLKSTVGLTLNNSKPTHWAYRE